jgi:uncharacterized protein (UPF0548 family)
VIRPTEVRELTAEGESLSEIAAAFAAQVPAGWQLTQSHVAMPKGTTKMTATGRMARWGETRDIEADDLAALRAQVPDGWQLMSVRRA